MTNLASASRPVKPSKPRTIKPAVLASCTCLARPAYHCELLPHGQAGVVEINGTSYDLLPLGDSTRKGYRLTNHDNGNVYDVDTSSGYPECDCPDYLSRRGTVEHPFCKHGLALIRCRKDGVI